MSPKLVGTWGARSADELLGALGGPGAAAADAVELRLDFPSDGPARVRELVAAAGARPVIATCRRAAEGGGFAAGERDRIDVLLRAAGAGAAWLDVEDDVPDRDVERLRASGARLIRSAHLPALPADAEALADRLLAAPADAAKLVVRHGDAAAALRLLTIVHRAESRLAGHVVDVPFTRPASAAVGAPFVYAALAPGGRIGLRMPTVLEMRRRSRFSRIDGARPLFVLIGADVEGSVSPDMLNAAFEARGPDAVALRWSCDDPAPALEAIRRFGWLGAAVTIPHKERVFDLLLHGEGLGSRAMECAAANTVVLEGGALTGRNTDVAGLAEALATCTDRASVAGRPFLVLGAGGAARAAVAVARDLGARPIVWARRPEEARRIGCEVASAPDGAAALAPAVVVDATPAGPPGGTPLLDPAKLPQRAVVLDMLVHARPTALLAAAERAGHCVVPGFEMLLAQAARQVTLLGGPSPDRGAMRAAGEAWLRRRDRPIVLVGLRCAGKTTVGERLARLLGRTFVDTDRECERRTGRPVEEMLAAGEESSFRLAEAQALRAAADVPGAVVACGGGAALHEQAFGELAAWGLVVLLDAPDETLLARRAGSPRTPLTGLAPPDELAAQRAERLPVYRAAARLVVDAASGDADRLAERIAAWWDALPADDAAAAGAPAPGIAARASRGP